MIWQGALVGAAIAAAFYLGWAVADWLLKEDE